MTLVFNWCTNQLVLIRHHAFIALVLNICSQNMVTIVCATFNTIKRDHVITERRKTHCRYDILQLWYPTPNLKLKKSTWFINAHRIQEFSIQCNSQKSWVELELGRAHVVPHPIVCWYYNAMHHDFLELLIYSTPPPPPHGCRSDHCDTISSLKKWTLWQTHSWRISHY